MSLVAELKCYWKNLLGPLLFNFYINDLFFTNEYTNVCNYADDATFYVCNNDLNTLIMNLEHDSLISMEWFECIYMKLNESMGINLKLFGQKECKIWKERNVKLLGINIDSQLNFNNQVSSICKKAGRKLTALIRLMKLLTIDQRRILMKSSIASQFNY